eukprot:c5432_g1_i1.p1 GENE.c5432_g1_i1~~c5432_g1_i1.p1  ORF type:complete len:211 (-),score=29.09 c5432_g1_i1:36-668(-)
MSVQMAKQALRKSMRNALRDVPVQHFQTAGGAIASRVVETSMYQNSNSIGIFLGTKTEVDTLVLLRQALLDGKKCFFPVITNLENSLMEFRQIHSLDQLSSFVPDKMGVLCPPEGENLTSEEPGEIDLFITPGLAFDRQGHRLGKGKGFYDRYFKMSDATRLARQCPTSYKVGVGLDLQVVDCVPVDDDVNLTDLVTPSLTLSFARNACL